MRPVDKGAGAGYVPPDTLSWNKLNNKKKITPAWKAISAVSGVSTSPLVLPLTTCLQLALDAVVATDPTANQTTAKKAIIEKATEIYKTAAGPLATAVGPFCSYCETAIPGLLEVEHVAPKASYPTLMTTWANFLLSCGPCNNKKSENPDRAAAAVNPPPPALDPSTGTDTAFYDKIRNMYAWPDWWNGTFQFFPIDFQMSPDNGATWQSMSLADASNLQDNYLVSQDLNTRAIRADIVHGGQQYANVLVAAVVLPWDQNLVQLCGLNNPGNTGGNKTYDRRLYNRTLAWFQILEVMRPLMNIDDEQTFLQLWPIIQYSSASTGFWSLWVTLLSQYNDFDNPPHSLGYWLFASANAATFYPGTNATNIVLPPRQ
jgi:hypothetical protein